VGDVAVIALGAGLAEFLAFAHENHRRSPVDSANGLGAATSLPGSSYPPDCTVVIGPCHVFSPMLHPRCHHHQRKVRGQSDWLTLLL